MPQRGNFKGRANRALDAANFTLADVRDGLGPHLAIYLLTEQHWDEAQIGLVMAVASFAGIAAQTPAGALVDATRAKRLAMVAAAILAMPASLALPLFPTFWPVAITQGVAHAASAIFPPALAAVSLGIAGHRAFTRRIGRNETFNHAGNATAALIAGGSAYLFGPTVVFYLLATMSLASVVSVLAIPKSTIDHEIARGLHDADPGDAAREQPSGFTVLVTCRPLLVFALCAMLFHLSNAAMLPLVGQKLASQDEKSRHQPDVGLHRGGASRDGTGGMAHGVKADSWGHERFFLAALAILPLRGGLYTLSDNPAWLVGVQLLDGIGAGIFGAIFPVIVADLMRNTGQFYVAQGAVATAQGIGARPRPRWPALSW